MTLTMPTATYPEEPKAKRQALLAAVENLRGVIEAGVEETERISTLPQATVDAIHAAGLFAYKSARVLAAKIEAILLEQASRKPEGQVLVTTDEGAAKLWDDTYSVASLGALVKSAEEDG